MGADTCIAAVAAVVHRWWPGCGSLTRVCNNNGGCCIRGQVCRVRVCDRDHVTVLVICALAAVVVLSSRGHRLLLLLLLLALAIFKLKDARPHKPVRERELAELAQRPEMGLVR